MKVWSNERGFALPTVVMASMVLMVVLSAAISITSSTSVALREQYYSQVMKNAAGGCLNGKGLLAGQQRHCYMVERQPITAEYKL